MNDKLISANYLDQNAQLHAQNAKYGASGHAWTDRVVELLGDADTYLDYGCGKGQLAASIEERLKHVSVRRYDPVTHPDMPQPADFVTCCDVLEHVEPELLDNVLAHLSALTLDRGLFVISLRPSNKRLPDGRNAHLILKPAEWWMVQLAKHFKEVTQVDPLKDSRVGKELAVLVSP